MKWYTRFCARYTIALLLAAQFLSSAVYASYPVTYARRAASWDEQQGIDFEFHRVSDDGVDEWKSIARSCDKGDWIKFSGVHFAEAMYDSIIVWYNKRGEEYGTGIVEIRLDKLDGALLTSFETQETSTSHAFIFKPHIAALPKVIGTHDVYIVIASGTNICRLGKIILSGTMEAGDADVKTYYVARYGDDANDGLSIEKPFLTIQKAARVMKPGSKCLIRGGTYRETVTPVYTGVAGAELTFEPYNNETVVISGAEVLSGWTKHKDNIFKAPMNWDLGKTYNQLFVNGISVFEARTPNADIDPGDAKHIRKVNKADGSDMFNVVLKWGGLGQANDTTRMASASFGCSSGDPIENAFNRPDGFFDGAVYWNNTSWRPAIGEIKKSVNADGRMNFEVYSWVWMGMFGYGYVFGTLNLLDNPNEWARLGDDAYLWAPGSKDPSALTVEAKKRILAFDLTGKSYVTIKNLNVFASSVTLRNADHCIIDGLHAKYISHFILWSPHWSWPGENDDGGFTGIFMGGSDNIIKNSTIEQSASSGINLDGKRNRIENCYIHHCNYSSTYGAGIVCGGANFECQIQRNDIYQVGRSCVHSCPTAGNILYNKLHEGMFYSQEGTLIYTYGPGDFRWKGEEIAYNWLYSAQGRLAAGIGCDGGGQANWLIHHNVFWHGTSPQRNPSNTCGNVDHNIIFSNTYIDSPYQWMNWNTPQENHNELYFWRGGNDLWKLGDPHNEKGSGFDFMPQEGSAAIDAGVESIAAAHPKDREIIPEQKIADFKGARPDLGAYESGGEKWVPGPVGYKEPVWPFPVKDVLDQSADAGFNIASRNRRPSIRILKGFVLATNNAATAGYLMIYNAAGGRISRISLKAGETVSIPVRSLPPGLYVMTVQAGGIKILKKFFALQ